MDKKNIKLSDDYYEAGEKYENEKNFALALENHLKSLELREQIKNGSMYVAKSQYRIGVCYTNLGDYPKAVQYYKRSYEVRKKNSRNPDNDNLAFCLRVIGDTYSKMNKLDEALDYLFLSLNMCRRIKSIQQEYKCMFFIGLVYSMKNEHEKALEYHQQEFEYHKKLSENGDSIQLALCYRAIGDTYRQMNKFDRALENLFESLRMLERQGSIKDQARCLYLIGVIYNQLNEPETALDYHLEALKIRQDNDMGDDLIAYSYFDLGVTYNELNDHEKALEYHLKSLEMREKISNSGRDSPNLDDSYFHVGLSYEKLNKHQEALANHEKCVKIRSLLTESDKNKLKLAESYKHIGLMYASLNNFTKALDNHLKCLEIVEKQQPYSKELAECLTKLSLCYDKLNEPDKAKEYDLKSKAIQYEY